MSLFFSSQLLKEFDHQAFIKPVSGSDSPCMPLSAEERQQCQSSIALIQERCDLPTKQKENRLRAMQRPAALPLLPQNQTSAKAEQTNQRNYLTRFLSLFQQEGQLLTKTNSKHPQNSQQCGFQVQLDHQGEQQGISTRRQAQYKKKSE